MDSTLCLTRPISSIVEPSYAKALYPATTSPAITAEGMLTLPLALNIVGAPPAELSTYLYILKVELLSLTIINVGPPENPSIDSPIIIEPSVVYFK